MTIYWLGFFISLCLSVYLNYKDLRPKERILLPILIIFSILVSFFSWISVLILAYTVLSNMHKRKMKKKIQSEKKIINKTKELTAEEFIKLFKPYLREGYLAMDFNNVWFWFKAEPNLDDRYGWNSRFSDNESYCLKMFKIKPVKNWQESLIKI